MATIPDVVLSQIAKDRPDLAGLVEKIRTAHRPQSISELETLLSRFYLTGVSKLSQEETTDLIACVAGRGYGARRCEAR